MVLTSPSDVAALGRLLSWWEYAEYVAEVFIILGCVGEYTAEYKIKDIQLGKQSLRILIVGLGFSLIALGRTNGLSGQEIAEAQRGTAEVQRDAETAKEHASEAEERAAKADLARVQLEERMAWRTLSQEQGDALCSAIPAKLLDKVKVMSSPEDSEAFRYANDFNGALNRCTAYAGLPQSGLGVGWYVFRIADCRIRGLDQICQAHCNRKSQLR